MTKGYMYGHDKLSWSQFLLPSSSFVYYNLRDEKDCDAPDSERSPMAWFMASESNADPGTGQTYPSDTDDACVPRDGAMLLKLSRLSKLPTRLPGRDMSMSSLSGGKASAALAWDAYR